LRARTHHFAYILRGPRMSDSHASSPLPNQNLLCRSASPPVRRHTSPSPPQSVLLHRLAPALRCRRTLLRPRLSFTPPRRRCLSAALHPRAAACATARCRRCASSSHLMRTASPAPRSHPLARTQACALHLPLSVFCARQVFDVLPQRQISSFALRVLHC
jgi:hypothetical protein